MHHVAEISIEEVHRKVMRMKMKYKYVMQKVMAKEQREKQRMSIMFYGLSMFVDESWVDEVLL